MGSLPFKKKAPSTFLSYTKLTWDMQRPFFFKDTQKGNTIGIEGPCLSPFLKGYPSVFPVPHGSLLGLLCSQFPGRLALVFGLEVLILKLYD
jgi:hypothetical protein